MRYYIEEIYDYFGSDDFVRYVIKIKDYTREELIEEVLSNLRLLYRNCDYLHDDEWIEDFREARKDDAVESLITESAEEKFYLLDTEEEHRWNEHVAHCILSGESWVDRFSGEVSSIPAASTKK